MSAINTHIPYGATALSRDELDGLIPNYITTHAELNELEQQNIQDGIQWVRSRRNINVLEMGFVLELHRQMFGQVWKWAGILRRSDKNIGVPWQQVITQTAQLLETVRYWVENKTFPIDEIAARLHHRLVEIHLFANGNGRHARLLADLLLETQGEKSFSWGEKTSKTPMEAQGVRREDYIAALKSADRGNYIPLLAFVRA